MTLPRIITRLIARLTRTATPLYLVFILDEDGRPAIMGSTVAGLSREETLRDLFAGAFERPYRVLSFCPDGGWCEDVSKEFARLWLTAIRAGHTQLEPDTTPPFVAEFLGEDE